MSIDPITLEVIAGALRSACEEAGETLVRAAHSANIKERRDCSTALFDASGEMIVQAAHIPVHLGSMPEAVAAVAGEDHAPGDNWVLNDPFRGGTHLPDITLITPVFEASTKLLGFVASRAHHADVGGPTPGGMPADSRTLDDEGVVIPPSRVDPFGSPERRSPGKRSGGAGSLRAGYVSLDSIAEQMRDPQKGLADLRAQRAANLTASSRLAELVAGHGGGLVREAMTATLDRAEGRARDAIARLADGRYESADVLEGDWDGDVDIPLRISATVDGDRIELDFAGTSAQVDGNLNCPLPVTRSAALFAVRVLTDPDAPVSAGAHRPVSIHCPEGSLLNARPPAAVAAGNVETSSRVADLTMAALGQAVPGGAPAQGQGTMNNLTLAGGEGEASFTYYETIGGGQGACPGADGPSAVHVTMSNTLNTPVEALEAELPVRVRELSVRRGSGGEGERRGGDGVVREIEALAPMAFTLITERRRHAPRGAAGGRDGGRGRNLLNGEELPSKASGQLKPGDVLRIETPGGGGWGTP